ncbi:hypothetical protein [Azospirillum sp. TSO22-1]|uniref:hypothetical protein n=1 Tax=Azospirillum sp. TSO22-1 TaxID=716789 RepID=UPI000D64D204|nr:hypothetical protein [Azospirillum sp. TSO22-1]
MTDAKPSLKARLEKVKQTLLPLNRGVKAQLFDYLVDKQLTSDPVGAHIAAALLEVLNGNRTEHARRLWTGWLEPVIVREDELLYAERRLPGCLHIADAGGWWKALSPRLAHVAVAIQGTIEERSRTMPLDGIFASESARQWADMLRLESLAKLSTLRAVPQARTKFLAAANAERLKLLATADRGAPVPLDAGDFDTLFTVLEAAPAWTDVPRPAHQAEAGEIVALVEGLLERSARRPEAAALYATAHLHGRAEPATAVVLHHEFALPLVDSAIVAHLRFAGQRLREAMRQGLSARGSGSVRAQRTANPDTLLDRYFGWYDAAHAAHLDQVQRPEAEIRASIGELLTLLEEELIPALTRRILELNEHVPPAAALSGVRFVRQFKDRLWRRGLVASPNPWPSSVGEHLTGLFRQIVASPREDRLTTLAHLTEIADLVGYPVEITALDEGLLTVVREALPNRDRCGPAELRLIERVLAVAVSERRKSRWWISEEMRTLLAETERLDPELLRAAAAASTS